MAREFSRTQRIAEQIQRELAQLVQREVKDPRMGMVTVNAVKVSKDLSYADVYVTVMGSDENEQSIATSLSILNKAAGFLRGRVSQAIKLRVMPQLRFHYDASVARGNYLSALINEAVETDRQRAGQPDADDDDAKRSED